jgi:DNA invertase Pin-like site-specific DNA recombinase
MIAAKRWAFDAVMVFRFYRFAPLSLTSLERSMSSALEFVSLHEAIDTSTPIARVMFHIAGAFAELE